MKTETITMTLDLKGLSCPMPIVKTAKAFKDLSPGDTVEVLATDRGSVPDFTAWCRKTGNTLLEHDVADGVYRFVVRKE